MAKFENLHKLEGQIRDIAKLLGASVGIGYVQLYAPAYLMTLDFLSGDGERFNVLVEDFLGEIRWIPDGDPDTEEEIGDLKAEDLSQDNGVYDPKFGSCVCEALSHIPGISEPEKARLLRVMKVLDPMA